MIIINVLNILLFPESMNCHPFLASVPSVFVHFTLPLVSSRDFSRTTEPVLLISSLILSVHRFIVLPQQYQAGHRSLATLTFSIIGATPSVCRTHDQIQSVHRSFPYRQYGGPVYVCSSYDRIVLRRWLPDAQYSYLRIFALRYSGIFLPHRTCDST